MCTLSIITVRTLLYLTDNTWVPTRTLLEIISFTILSATGNFGSVLKSVGVLTSFFVTCLGSDFSWFRISCKLRMKKINTSTNRNSYWFYSWGFGNSYVRTDKADEVVWTMVLQWRELRISWYFLSPVVTKCPSFPLVFSLYSPTSFPSTLFPCPLSQSTRWRAMPTAHC